MHERTSLDSREYSLIKIKFLCDLSTAHDHTASGASQCLMGSSCGHMGIWNGTWMNTCCHQTCDMGDIYHKISSGLISDLTEFLKINDPAVGTGPCNDQL